jgi:hypothetical protein
VNELDKKTLVLENTTLALHVKIVVPTVISEKQMQHTK